MASMPSLLDICLKVASEHRHYTDARGLMEILPEHIANRLLALVLKQQGPNALSPTQLEHFRHCVTRVVLRGSNISAEWLAALAGFAHLEELQLRDCPRLDAAALAPLAAGPCAASLRRLQVAGCGKLGDGVLPYIGQLTGLRSLSLSDAGVLGASSSLDALSALSGLTQLFVYSPQVLLCGLLPRLPLLKSLDFTGIEDEGGKALLALSALTRLSIPLSTIKALPALPGLQDLDLRYCRLTSATEEATGLAALIRAAAGILQRVDLSEVKWGGDTGGGPMAGEGGSSSSVRPWAPVLGALGCCPCLTRLDLSNTGVRPEHLALLERATSLRQLRLSYSRTCGSVEGAAALAAAAPGLQSLDLCSCGVTDACVPWLQQLTALTSLDLSYNEALTLAPQQRPQQQQQQQQQQVEAHAGAAVGVAAAAPAAAPDQGEGAWEAPAPADMWAPAPGAPAPDAALRAQGICPWPLLQRLSILRTRVEEAGLRALCGGGAAGARGAPVSGQAPEGADGGSGGTGAAVGAFGGAGAYRYHGGVDRGCRLTQLTLGGEGATDGMLAVVARGMPRLCNLEVQFAPCTPHGLERLAAAPSLQRLDVHCCDLVPDSGEQLQHLAQALQGLREFKIAWVRPDAVGGQGRSVQVVGECVLGGYAIAGGGYLRMFWRRGEKRVR